LFGPDCKEATLIFLQTANKWVAIFLLISICNYTSYEYPDYPQEALHSFYLFFFSYILIDYDTPEL
jgi:hypothetical protein